MPPSGSTPRRCWAPDPRACRPYRAKTKGKVERVIREVKEDFLAWLGGPGAAGAADPGLVRRRGPALGARGGGHASPPDDRADRRRGVGRGAAAADARAAPRCWPAPRASRPSRPVTAPVRGRRWPLRRRDRRGPAAGRLCRARPMSRAAESRVATAYARLREHLAYLGLTTASEHLAAELERASDERSAPVEVLERLLAVEVEATAARRLRAGSASPTTRSTSAWPSSSSTSSPRSTGRSSPSSRPCASSRSAATSCCSGRPGVGKTPPRHRARDRRHRGRLPDLLHDRRRHGGRPAAAHLEGSWSAKMRTYTGPSVLVIDELGYLPLDQPRPTGSSRSSAAATSAARSS